MLGIDDSGVVQAMIKDALNGNLIRKIPFSQSYEPLFFAAVHDANGDLTNLAVLGRSNVHGLIRAQIKRVSDGSLVNNVKFGTVYSPVAFMSSADSNGSGGSEIVVVGVSPSGKVRALVRETADDAIVSTMFFSRNFPPLAAIAVNGVAGTGRNEIAVIGQHANGNQRLVIKDLVSGATVNKITLP